MDDREEEAPQPRPSRAERQLQFAQAGVWSHMGMGARVWVEGDTVSVDTGSTAHVAFRRLRRLADVFGTENIVVEVKPECDRAPAVTIEIRGVRWPLGLRGEVG